MNVWFAVLLAVGFLCACKNGSKSSVSDNDIKSFLFERYGMTNPLDIQALPKEQRNELLQALKEFGGGVRQLSRITGVSYGIIQRI